MVYGFLLSIIIALSSEILSKNFLPIGSVTIAVFLGVLTRNFILKNNNYTAGINILEKKALPIAIMLLGTELNFSILINLGLKSVLFIGLMIFFTIYFSYLLGRMFKFEKKFSLLLGIGNAVCGSSAIAATAPILKVNEEDIAFSMTMVNLMGSIGIFLMPLLANLFHFNNIQSGVLIGGTLQAVGQVVASGFSMNNIVGNLAVVIKMGRVLSLSLVIIGLNFMRISRNSSNKSKINLPYFLIGFFILSIISSINLLPLNIIHILSQTGQWLLLISMASIGLKINFSSLLKKGKRLLILETFIEFFQIILAFVLIKILY